MKSLVIFSVTSLLSLSASLPLAARSPDNLQDILRETRITADVMNSALRRELRRNVRVTQLHAEYLAAQGVLVSIKMNTPWLKFDEQGDAQFEFHGNISLPEIPAMVNDILQELEINMSPYEPEALEGLRDLREEQRQLRMEARERRSELRSKRRELVREDPDDNRYRELEREIDQLQEEIPLIESQYEALSAEIDAHYQTLKQAPAPMPAPQPAAAPAPSEPANAVDLDLLLTQTVCDYGSTLKSVPGDQYLTLAVQQGQDTNYLAFRMSDVNNCGRAGGAEKLLERAYQYQG